MDILDRVLLKIRDHVYEELKAKSGVTLEPSEFQRVWAEECEKRYENLSDALFAMSLTNEKPLVLRDGDSFMMIGAGGASRLVPRSNSPSVNDINNAVAIGAGGACVR